MGAESTLYVKFLNEQGETVWGYLQEYYPEALPWQPRGLEMRTQSYLYDTEDGFVCHPFNPPHWRLEGLTNGGPTVKSAFHVWFRSVLQQVTYGGDKTTTSVRSSFLSRPWYRFCQGVPRRGNAWGKGLDEVTDKVIMAIEEHLSKSNSLEGAYEAVLTSLGFP